jgi:outer membrane protein assembly factor BamB
MLLAAVVAAPGFVKPDPDTLRRVIGVRQTRDLSEFELLEINDEEWTTPLISDDNVRAFVATRRGRLFAIDLETGDELWKRDDMGSVGFAMIEHQQHLIVGSDSALVALDQQIGKERWRLDLDAPIGGRIARAGKVAIIPIRSNSFVAVDLEKGERLWLMKRPTPDGITVRGQAPPAIDAHRRRAYLGFSDGALAAVDLETGTAAWVAILGDGKEFFADVDTRPIVVGGGDAIIAASYNTGLFRLDAATGSIRWKRPEKRISGLTEAGSGFLVASHGDRQVLGIYASSGKVRWRYQLEAGAPVEPVFIGRNLVVVGCTAGPIAVLDVDTGRPVQLLTPGSGVSVPPAWDDPDLVALSNKALLVVARYGAGGFAAPESLGGSRASPLAR